VSSPIGAGGKRRVGFFGRKVGGERGAQRSERENCHIGERAKTPSVKKGRDWEERGKGEGGAKAERALKKKEGPKRTIYKSEETRATVETKSERGNSSPQQPEKSEGRRKKSRRPLVRRKVT